MRTLRNFIDGGWVPSDSADHLTLRNPATEEPIGALPAGSEADVDRAVRAAADAAADWAGRPLDERLRLLERAARTLIDHSPELAEIECEEMGRPPHAGEAWIRQAGEGFLDSLDQARSYPFEQTIIDDDRTRSTVKRQPLGVVAFIVPWNYASTMVISTLGPLLACGNTVVVKPSEKASIAPSRIVELIGPMLPPGVLDLVLGDGRSGAALSRHAGVGLVHFTGSVPTGRAVAADAAANLTRAVLELGGKDPVIVDADVDIDVVARDVAYGSFLNTGQICTSMERIYVHADIAGAFVDALVEEARSYSHGDGRRPGVAIGPLVDERQRRIVAAHVEDAVSKGARVRTGGRIPAGPGYFYPATVLTDVTDDMLIMREETFGPVAPVQTVATFREGLDKAAASPFGLAATVYTNDPEHIMLSSQLPAALTWINKWRGNSAGCTFEPAGQSGLGPSGADAAFDAGTRPAATIHTDPSEHHLAR